MSEVQIREIICKEAQLLGLSTEEAIDRVHRGEIGPNYLWADLAALVHLLEE
jgi:hypothetical protein